MSARIAWAFSLLLAAPLAMGEQASRHHYRPPSKGDRRGPCPMMNSLANHGFIPRSGLNITGDELRSGFVNGVNIDGAAIDRLVQAALSVSTTGVPGTFDLPDLADPFTEHDGSLSRADRYGGGDVLAFNEAIWKTTLAHFPDPVITVQQAATARADRLKAAAAENPEFGLSDSERQSSFFETTAYLLFLGRSTNGTARRDFVRALFEEERLPYREGWTKPDSLITLSQIMELDAKVKAATPSGSVSIRDL